MTHWKDRLIGAVLAEFPGASPVTDCNIESTPDGPVIKIWNEDVLGPYFEAEWQEKCEALYRTEAIEAVKGQHAVFMRQLTGNATIEERDTWAPKAQAAERYINGTPTDAERLMIETEAQFRQIDPTEFAMGVKAKADAFARLIGLAGGIKSKAEAAIRAAETTEDIKAALEASGAEAAVALKQWLSAA